MNNRSLVILVIVIAAAAGALWAWTIRGTDLSDEVMIANAVDYLVATEPTELFTEERGGTPDDYPVVPYASADEFTAANPDCCSFGEYATDGYRPPFLYRLTRDYAGIVTVKAGWKVAFPDGEQMVEIGDPVEITMTRKGVPIDTLPLK